MQLQLKVISYRKQAPAEALGVEIDRTPAVIGRESGADVRMILPDPSDVISRRHARIEFRNEKYFLTDISQNGVLNTDSGESLEFNVPYAIGNHDRFTIGDYIVEAQLTATEQEPEIAAYVPQVSGNPDAVQRGGWQDPAKKPSWWPSEGESDGEQALGRGDRLSLADRPRPSFKDIPMAPPGNVPRNGQDKPRETDKDGNKSRHRAGDISANGGDQSGNANSRKGSIDRVAADETEQNSSDYVPGGFGLKSSAREQHSPISKPPPSSTGEAKRPDSDAGEQRHADVQETAAQPATEELERVMREVLVILGIPDLPVRTADAPEVLQTIAAILRAVLAETIEVLRIRDKFKYEHRITGSVLYNNPLKFALSVEDAVDRMLWPRGKGQLPPVEAVRQTFMDILAHQAALMGAAEGAVRGGGSLARFDPKRLEQDWFQEISGLEHHLAIKRKAKLWDLYTANFRGLANEATDAFEKEFEEKFTHAYSEQLASLRAAGIGGPVKDNI